MRQLQEVAGGFRYARVIEAAMVVAALFSDPWGQALADPLELTPRLSVSEEYNDNIFFTKDRTEEYVTSVTPGLSLQYRRPTLTLSLSGGSSAQAFARRTSQDNLFRTQSGAFDASYQASPRFTINVTDSVTRVGRTRTGSAQPPTAAPPPGVQQPGPSTQVSTLLPRGAAVSNFFGATASYALAPRWTSSVAYRNALNDFSNPGRRDITHAANLAVSYAWNPALSANVFYSFTRLQLGTVPDTESHSGGLGIGYQFDPAWSVSASAGVFVNRPIESGGGSISTRIGPTFNVTLTKLFERSSVSAGGSQQITSSAGVAGASETRDAFLRYQIRLLPHLSGSLSTNFSDFNTNGADFQTLTLQAGLSYSLWRYISIGLNYSHRRRDSNQAVSRVLDEGVVDGNLIQVRLTASYPVWKGSL